MDIVAVLRAAGGLATVLGLLAGALWLMRRYKLSWPGMPGGARETRLQLVERLSIDQRRSVLLIRRDDREHLVLIGPDSTLVLEAGIRPFQAAAERSAAPASFAAMLRTAGRHPTDV